MHFQHATQTSEIFVWNKSPEPSCFLQNRFSNRQKKIKRELDTVGAPTVLE